MKNKFLNDLKTLTSENVKIKEELKTFKISLIEEIDKKVFI